MRQCDWGRSLAVCGGEYFRLWHRASWQLVNNLQANILLLSSKTNWEDLGRFRALCSGPDSVVGIATDYELDGPGIESRWVEIFRTCPDRSWGPPSLLYNGYRVFPGGKERPGRDADPSPLLVPWTWKGRAIPLLPLWAVRLVQSLNACTRVHFTHFTQAL